MEERDALVERVAEAIWDSEQRRVQDDYSINGVFELVVTRWDEAGERNRQWMRGIARAAIAAVRAEGDELEALLERLTDGATYGTIHYDTRQPDPFRWLWIASFDKPTGGFERVTGSGATLRAAVEAALGEGE